MRENIKKEIEKKCEREVTCNKARFKKCYTKFR